MSENIKNQMTIILDTSQEEFIKIGKSEESRPTTMEELRKMVTIDIATLCEALVVTIRGANKMGLVDEAQSMRNVINHLNSVFVDSKLDVDLPIWDTKTQSPK